MRDFLRIFCDSKTDIHDPSAYRNADSTGPSERSFLYVLRVHERVQAWHCPDGSGRGMQVAVLQIFVQLQEQTCVKLTPAP